MTDVAPVVAPMELQPSPEVATRFVTEHGKGLVVGLLLMALLPIPFTLLGVLPTYRVHARFLVFYTPLVCFLTVGYCFYMRDVLARVLFKHLLDPPPEADPYYRPSVGELLQRAGSRVRVLLLALAPVALVAASFYCVINYVERLQESVGVVGPVLLNRMPDEEQSRFFAVDRARASAAQPSPTGMPATAVEQSPISQVPESASPPPPAATRGQPSVDRVALRRHVLQAASIEDIAYFGELTTLYIGGFACVIAAAMLMILKEHAREVLGLSEESLLLGAEPELLE